MTATISRMWMRLPICAPAKPNPNAQRTKRINIIVQSIKSPLYKYRLKTNMNLSGQMAISTLSAAHLYIHVYMRTHSAAIVCVLTHTYCKTRDLADRPYNVGLIYLTKCFICVIEYIQTILADTSLLTRLVFERSKIECHQTCTQTNVPAFSQDSNKGKRFFCFFGQPILPWRTARRRP
jgi:hypothetical protein